MKKCKLYFLKLAARARNIPGVSSLSVKRTSLGCDMVAPNALSMELPLMRETMSGKLAVAKLCSSFIVTLPVSTHAAVKQSNSYSRHYIDRLCAVAIVLQLICVKRCSEDMLMQRTVLQCIQMTPPHDV